jgi:hypothetical protein
VSGAVIDDLRRAFAARPRSWVWSRIWLLVVLGYWLSRRQRIRAAVAAPVRPSMGQILRQPGEMS